MLQLPGIPSASLYLSRSKVHAGSRVLRYGRSIVPTPDHWSCTGTGSLWSVGVAWGQGHWHITAQSLPGPLRWHLRMEDGGLSQQPNWISATTEPSTVHLRWGACNQPCFSTQICGVMLIIQLSCCFSFSVI